MAGTPEKMVEYLLETRVDNASNFDGKKNNEFINVYLDAFLIILLYIFWLLSWYVFISCLFFFFQIIFYMTSWSPFRFLWVRTGCAARCSPNILFTNNMPRYTSYIYVNFLIQYGFFTLSRNWLKSSVLSITIKGIGLRFEHKPGGKWDLGQIWAGNCDEFSLQ